MPNLRRSVAGPLLVSYTPISVNMHGVLLALRASYIPSFEIRPSVYYPACCQYAVKQGPTPQKLNKER